MVTCCSRECCGGFWAVALTGLLVIAWATPWYFTVIDTDQCDYYILQGWRQEYCGTSGSNCDSGTCPNGASYNWRDSCTATDGGSCSHIEKLYDTTAGLLAVSFVSAVLITIVMLVRCCSATRKNRRPWHMIVASVGFVFLVVAVGYYAGQYPKAVEDDYGGSCPHLVDCDSFFGGRSGTIASQTIDVAWGGLGWIFAALAIPVYIVVAVLACLPSREQTEGLLAHDQVAYVAYQPAPSYQPVYAAYQPAPVQQPNPYQPNPYQPSQPYYPPQSAQTSTY